MKRSEMVLILIAAVLEHCYDNIELVEDEASNILKELETAGMLPPIEPGRTVRDLDLGAPEWEAE